MAELKDHVIAMESDIGTLDYEGNVFDLSQETSTQIPLDSLDFLRRWISYGKL